PHTARPMPFGWSGQYLVADCQVRGGERLVRSFVLHKISSCVKYPGNQPLALRDPSSLVVYRHRTNRFRQLDKDDQRKGETCGCLLLCVARCCARQFRVAPTQPLVCPASPGYIPK